MNEIILNGTEVLIFRDMRKYQEKLDDTNFIKGTIISSKESCDLSHHGSSWYEQIYTILGEDDKQYIATYKDAYVTDFFIRTIDDHIKCISSSIKNNIEQIESLENKNKNLYNVLEHLNQEKSNLSRTRNLKEQ